MIPVRIAATTRPPRATTTPRDVADGHPLFDAPCPVCDRRLGGTQVHLIVVGADPEDRSGAWHTGAAVAVHVACALPEEGE